MNVITRLRDLRRREHECTVELIRQLIVCQREKAYLDHGCSTLFAFLVEELKYSPAAASRRYKAMRVATRFPRVLDLLARHELTLCSLAQAESLLGEVADPQALLDRIRGKSSREVEKVVARERAVPRKPRESVRPVVVKPKELPLLSTPEEFESRYSVRTTLNESDYDDFERARAIVSRKKLGATVEDVLVELTQFYLEHKAPKQRSKPAKPTKQIPRSTRDAVMIRDGHRCTYVGRNGRRCTATHDLQIDHIKPRVLGGTHEPQNLRVLCGAHNRHEARRILGDRVCETRPRWGAKVPPSASADAGAPASIFSVGMAETVPPASSNAGTPNAGTPTPATPHAESAKRPYSGISNENSGSTRCNDSTASRSSTSASSPGVRFHSDHASRNASQATRRSSSGSFVRARWKSSPSERRDVSRKYEVRRVRRIVV